MGPQIPWLAAGQPFIAPPDIPWLGAAAGWGCPDGWRAVTDDDVVTCDPYPESGPAECPPGEAHFVGEPGCASIGRACGDGPYASVDDLDAEDLVYVRADAVAGGDGSEASPYASLAGALDAATSGQTLVLAAGAYVVDRAWPAGVSLRGRCARDTTLAAEDDTDRLAVLQIHDADDPVRIDGVSIGPTPVRAVWVRNATATLDGLVVAGATGIETPTEPGRACVVADAGSTVLARSIVVRDGRPNANGDGGRGVQAQRGGRLEVRRALLERNGDAGAAVFEASSVLLLEDVASRDNRVRESDQIAGYGISVQGGRAEARRVLLERNRHGGLVVVGSEVLLEDAVLRATQPVPDGLFGAGLVAVFDARIEARRVLIEGSAEFGMLIESGTGLHLDDVVVRGNGDVGLSALSGARVELSRALFEENRAAAVLLQDTDTAAVLEDIVVRDTFVDAERGEFGRALSVLAGSVVELRRALFERNVASGLFAAGAGSEVTVEDLVVCDTRVGQMIFFGGRGINVQESATLSGRRVLLERNTAISLFVATSGEAELTDFVSREVRGVELANEFGRGINLQDGARLELDRALVESSQEVGVVAFDASATLENVVVRDTAEPPCTVDCENLVPGVGVGPYQGGDIVMRQFEIATSAVCGVQIEEGGQLRLEDGVVRGNPIGVCLQDADYPLALVRRSVDYVDNEVNVESTSFPTPRPGGLPE